MSRPVRWATGPLGRWCNGAMGARRALLWGATALVVAGSLPFAAFGMRQLAETVAQQIAGPAVITDFLAYDGAGALFLRDPSRLYDVEALYAWQRQVQGGRETYNAYYNPPHVAAFFAPLALLPYGVAYAAWLGVNTACVAASAWLLAPRGHRGRRSEPWDDAGVRMRLAWWAWALGALMYLPVQFSLVMGQTSLVALLGFSGFAWLATRDRWGWAGLALLPWTWKPQMAATLVVALAAGRRWRAVAACAALSAALVLGGFAVVGLEGLMAYARLNAEKSALVSARAAFHPPGQTLLGLAQSMVGPGVLAGVVATLGGAAVWGLVGALWWNARATDGRDRLRLAALPLAAVVAAPHALVYEMASWLASVWLLAGYAMAPERTGAERATVWMLVLVLWIGGNLSVVLVGRPSSEWGAVAGIVGLVGIGWLARRTVRGARGTLLAVRGA